MNKKLSLLISVSAALAASHASAATIIASQSTNTGGAIPDETGGADYGQGFALDDSAFTDAAYTLDEMTFHFGSKGTNATGGAESTAYLDIYDLNGVDPSTLDFSDGTNVGSLSFLASSTNFIDLTSGFSGGDALTWTFSGIELTPSAAASGIQYIAVLSDTSAAGSHFGHSLRITDGSTATFSNLSDNISNPFFGGDVNDDSQDHQYSFTATTVPEPSSLAFLALSLGSLLLRRRRV